MQQEGAPTSVDVVVERKRKIPPRRTEPFTKREQEVFPLVMAGKSDGEIGTILDISPRTARFHIENVKRRLKVSTRIQASLEFFKWQLSKLAPHS